MTFCRLVSTSFNAARLAAFFVKICLQRQFLKAFFSNYCPLLLNRNHGNNKLYPQFVIHGEREFEPLPLVPEI